MVFDSGTLDGWDGAPGVLGLAPFPQVCGEDQGVGSANRSGDGGGGAAVSVVAVAAVFVVVVRDGVGAVCGVVMVAFVIVLGAFAMVSVAFVVVMVAFVVVPVAFVMASVIVSRSLWLILADLPVTTSKDTTAV